MKIENPSELTLITPATNEPLSRLSHQPSGQTEPTSNHAPSIERAAPIATHWQQFMTVAKTNFQHKSLANFSLNSVVGCTHGCLFCYVPSVSVNKQAAKLKPLGVDDPDGQWGDYAFPRMMDEAALIKSIERAAKSSLDQLPPDGHRAVMLSTTTDPYQVFRHTKADKGSDLTKAHSASVRRSLELIRDKSDLRVRILTRSPLAKTDFELFKTFGNRLLFGMSLPTLNDKLARVYEPHAPSPTQRLKTLEAAKTAGLNIYVAIAPTYPECDEADIRRTLEAVAPLNPFTVYHEPINIRAENVARIQAYADAEGIKLNTAVFASEEAWAKYSIEQLLLVERLAGEIGISDRLHLWPDKDLGKSKIIKAQNDPVAFSAWIQKYWNRISEWPGVGKKTVAALAKPEKPASPPAAPTLPQNKRLSVRSPDEILGMAFDQDDLYLENGVFANGQPLTILGPGGLGKSRLVLQFAVCTILKKPFLGLSVRSKNLKWLVLQAENSNRRLQTDLKALKAWVGEGDWATVERHMILHTLEEPEDTHLSLKDGKVVTDLGRLIAEERPDVIAFDPLSSVAVGNLNNDAGMQATCQAIAKLARAGGKLASVVVLHHTLTGKAGASKATGFDRGAYGRGSKALNFWTRGQINIAAANHENNERLVVTCGKNSNGKEFDTFGIRLNPKSLIYEFDPDFNIGAWREEIGTATQSKPQFSPEKVAEFVKDESLNKKELVKAIMDEHGCGKSTAYNAITGAEGKSIKRNVEKKFEPIT